MNICGTPASYRFTWPGHDEKFICEQHSRFLVRVAEAIGLSLQLIPLNQDEIKEHVCTQSEG